jgi:beta-glucanase (GH16 family)
MVNFYTPITGNSSYKLVFDDEFDGTSLNTNNWTVGWFQASDGLSDPINSAENGDYSSNQVSVSGGDLYLNAIQTTSTGPYNGQTYNYQSGVITSNQDFTYGYYEARIYLPPSSSGNIANWPAWWLIGPSASDGEIDIMEGLNGQATSTYHQTAGVGGDSQAASGNYTGWHVYGVLWTPGELQYYYDGQLQHTVTYQVTSSPLEMVLNYAVGGVGGPITAPASMEVDYVHVYQSTQYDSNPVAVTPEAGYGGPGDTGTSTSPLLPASSNDTVIKAGSTGAIIDASGNSWTITNGGQIAVNGTVDAVTANVVELAYVNGTIWQENSANLWYGETTPNDSWSVGTSTSPLPAASSNDTVIKAGSTAAIIDASGNSWTITNGGQVAVNGTVDAVTANVVELAYVNGTIWQENSSLLWWGETKPNDAWANTPGTATSPLPAPTPTPAPSANDTVVLAGSASAITDASGNLWTITNGGQVAVNGTVDAVTANVVELAFVNGTIWQENSSLLWWGETKPNDAWANTAGTATSPLPPPVQIGAATTTVSQSQVSVVATSGVHMVFISGSGDIVSLTGGTNTITDTGHGNTYIIPIAGQGRDVFTGDILKINDTLDLSPALAGTSWNGASSTLSAYVHVSNSGSNAVISISAAANSAATNVVTLQGGSGETLTSIIAHSIL